MDPKIIKLASGDALYANQDLIKFIKQTISQTSQDIKSGDNIYFFKNVTFKRDLLTVSQEHYSRVINMDKANVVIVNSNMTFPSSGISLKNNKLEKDLPHYEADDILFNISAMGAEYISVMEQWLQFFKLTNKPKVVFETNVIEYVNSGIVINEENYDEVVSILKNDRTIASRMLDTCNVKESFYYLLTMLYFNTGKFMNLDSSLYGSLMTTRHYLNQKSCGSTIPQPVFEEMMKIEFIRNRVTACMLQQITANIKSSIGEHEKLLDGYNVDILWKQ